MSKTIRVSEELYEAMDEYRSKDQTFQQVLDEMAEEFGLLPAKIRDADDLRTRLQSSYGYSSSEAGEVLESLRFVYTAQERPASIGVPHEAAEPRYGDEIDTLSRLGLVKEEHYTGKYDYGYRTTSVGSDISSELIRELIDENEGKINNLFSKYDEGLLGILLRFGFERTDSGHLTDRSAKLSGRMIPPFWDIPELLEEYQSLKSGLTDIGIASQYRADISRTVLPPEFTDYLQSHLGKTPGSLMAKIEIYQTLLDYTAGELDSREDIVNNLDTASEDDFKAEVEGLYQEGLTSRYLPNRDAPLLIKDREGIESRIEAEITQTLGIR